VARGSLLWGTIPSDPLGQAIVGEGIFEQRGRETKLWKTHLLEEIEILKREVSLGIHDKAKPTSVTINTGGGSSVINLGVIYGDVQQVINHINETGQRELAEFCSSLQRLLAKRRPWRMNGPRSCNSFASSQSKPQCLLSHGNPAS